jgi:L-threonylcarbamoyladenylate synthase
VLRVCFDGVREVDDCGRVESLRLPESVVTTGIADDPARPDPVVMATVKMPVDPEIAALDEIVVGVAEAGSSGDEAEPRVGRPLRRPRMGDRDGQSVERFSEGSGEPLPMRDRQLADIGWRQRQASSGRTHVTEVPLSPSHALISLMRAQQIEIPPSAAPDEADRRSGDAIGHDMHVAVQQDDAALRRDLTHLDVGIVEIRAVVLMIARDDDHRNGPTSEASQHLRGVAEVARHHEYIGIRNRDRHHVRCEIQMQIGEDLNAHGHRLACVGRPVRIEPSNDADLITRLTLEAWAGRGAHGNGVAGDPVDRRSSGHRLQSDDVRKLFVDGAVALVAHDASTGSPLGSVIVARDGDRRIELMKLAVPADRGRGVGSALIDAAVGWARDLDAEEIVLAVSQYQPHLCRLYDRHGFRVAPNEVYRHAAPGSPQPIVMVRRLTSVADSEDPVGDAVTALRQGGLVVLPTETVYGLAALASDPVAVRRVFATKGRPVDHPLIVHIANASAMQHWSAVVPAEADRLASTLWPGPLTIVMRRAAQVCDEVTGGHPTVALRVPSHPIALAVLGLLPDGAGIAAPSANRFGQVSPTTAAAAMSDLAAFLAPTDVVLDGGPCAVGIESTIVDLTGATPTILRPGGVSAERIEEVLGRRIERVALGPARAPGMLASHYAPRAGVLLARHDRVRAVVAQAQALHQRVGVLAPHGHRFDADVVVLDGPQQYDGAHLAPMLYERLRDADRLQLDVLVVVTPDEVGLGWAVADRLRRAAHVTPSD